MSSWFGGERDDDRRRPSSHRRRSSSHGDRDRARHHSSSATVIARQSSSAHHRSGSPPKYAFVRSKSSPTRSHSHAHKRDRSPSLFEVRSSRDRDRDRDRGGSSYGLGGWGGDATKSFTSLFGTLGGDYGDRYATRGGSSSYYKRRPRDGYIARLVHTIRRYLRQLMDYARRHPLKVLLLVVMPLVTGGALSKVVRGMGISVPAGLERFIGGGGGRGGFEGSSRGGEEGFGIEQAMNVAKMFI